MTLERHLLDHAGAAAALQAATGVPIEGPHPDDQFWIDQIQTSGERYGIPEARINNAGFLQYANCEETSAALWHKTDELRGLLAFQEGRTLDLAYWRESALLGFRILILNDQRADLVRRILRRSIDHMRCAGL